VAFAAAFEQAARGIEGEPLADAGEDIGEVAVLRPCVTDPAGCHQRQPQTPCKVDAYLIAMLLGAQTVALELDVDPVWEEVMKMIEFAFGGVEAAVEQTLGEDTLGTTGETEETVGVGLDLTPAGTGLALGPVARGLGQQAAEIAVAAMVTRQEREPRQGRSGGQGIRYEAQRPLEF